MTIDPATHLHQRKADGGACFDDAKRYLSLGWSALAVCPPDHHRVGRTHENHCESPGKAPWGQWKEFQDRLPTEDELYKKWCDNPTLNVGLALGPVSGLVRIDIDGPGGETLLASISKGILPSTLEFTSGRQNGGRGLLFRIPPGAKLRTTIERAGQPKQELRFQAKGAQTVLPPSRHPEGCLYAWTVGHSPWEIEAALAPDWLVAQLQVQHRPITTRTTQLREIGGVIPEGQRDSTLISIAGTMRRRGLSVESIAAALLVENRLRCQPPLDDSQVQKIAESVGRYPLGGATQSACIHIEIEV